MLQQCRKFPFSSLNLYVLFLHLTFNHNLVTNRIQLYFLYVDIDNRHRHLCVTGVTFMSSNTFLFLVPSWEQFFYKPMKIPSFHIWQNHTETSRTTISLLLITRGKINMTNFCNNFHSGILLGWQNEIAVLPIFSQQFSLAFTNYSFKAAPTKASILTFCVLSSPTPPSLFTHKT